MKTNLFEPDICPFCGSATLLLARRMAKDIFELIEQKEELEGFIKDAIRVVESMLDEKKIRSEMEVIAKEAFTNEILSLMDGLGNSVKLKLLDEKWSISFDYAWIYVKLWQERGWVGLKYGKANDFEKREKQYDDHDYILNLCVPIPDFALSEYEMFLRDYITKVLIPSVLEYKKTRLKNVLGNDFESVELKNDVACVAPGRKEYWRIRVFPDSEELEFLIANLITFFNAFTKPGMPTTYEEWLVLRDKQRKQDVKKAQEGYQLDIFNGST